MTSSQIAAVGAVGKLSAKLSALSGDSVSALSALSASCRPAVGQLSASCRRCRARAQLRPQGPRSTVRRSDHVTATNSTLGGTRICSPCPENGLLCVMCYDGLGDVT